MNDLVNSLAGNNILSMHILAYVLYIVPAFILAISYITMTNSVTLNLLLNAECISILFIS